MLSTLCILDGVCKQGLSGIPICVNLCFSFDNRNILKPFPPFP